MPKYILYSLLFLLASSSFMGCTKPVDFNQIDDFEVSPVLEASLIFFDAQAPDFFVGGAEAATVEDFVNLDVFQDSFINDNLLRTDIVVKGVNSIQRGYNFKVDFLNDLGQSQYSFIVEVEASPMTNEIPFEHTERIEGVGLEALKRSNKIVFTLIMLPGIPIDTGTLGRVHLESKAVFYFNYQKER
ncbi:hypothetical protein ACFFU9_06615 [Mariniflexile ostreae]|uniref:Uncharacterized protein n=1 Tax=Mariniflexile ostreae TaxID=1520892 RepID=A0ABV5FAD4_9FLAO